MRAFNEDTFLQETFAELVKTWTPSLLLETGTHMGDTTEYLATFGIPVISTEVNPTFYHNAKNKLQQENIRLLLGDSAKALEENFSLIKDERIIAFLDSHCLNDQVLERELELFTKLRFEPVIIIHDFYVPGKDFGYDTWDGHRYDYEFYKPYFDKIYDKYTYRYNENACGAKRGVIITEPSYE